MFGRIKRVFKKKRIRAKKNVNVALVAERNGWSYEKAHKKMKSVYDEYGITYRVYAQERMENMSPDKIAMRASKINAKKDKCYNKLLEVTGWDKEYADKELERVQKKYGIGMVKYFMEQYFLLSDEEIEAKIAEKKAADKERMARLMKKSGWSEDALRKHMKECTANYGTDAVEYELFRCWELTNEELDEYATLFTTRRLARTHNKGATKYTENKVDFDRYFKDFIQRKFWCNEPGATYESFLEFIDGLDELFCKPINLMQGRGAFKVKLSDWEPRALYDDFMSKPMFLIEECVKQHHLMNELYDGAVNTVRLVTILHDGESKIISSFIRIGANGSVVDNMVAGGILAGVNEETGEVITGAVDNTGEVHDVHPNTGAQILGFKIPNFEMAKEVALKAFGAYEGLGYIGWDVAICEDKAVIIEGNTLPGLASYQCAFAKEPYKKGMLYKFKPYM